jgi:peptidase E
MLKDCDAFENLREFALRDDTVVMGASAGSLIWGKSIDTVKDDELGLEDICDPNYVGLEDASGYDLLNGYSLFVHYKKKEEQVPKTMQRVERLLKEGYKLICLPEETIFDSKYKNLCN